MPHADAAVLRPGGILGLDELERLIIPRVATIEASALEIDLAEAEVRQARLLPNPVLDLGWGTIPLGPTNPPGLARPLANIPNYGVGLSFKFPVGKRRPAIGRAQALVEAARARLDATTRAVSLQLAGLLGQLAVATLRRDGVHALVDTAKRAVVAAEARLAAGFGTPFDVDRLQIDLRRLEQQLGSADSDISAVLAACTGVAAMPCEGFTNSAEARQFLIVWIDDPALASAALDERPDLRALSALERAAAAEQRLARAQGFPDPTVRLGYLHDRFIVAGNQRSSLELSVSFPLPIFDRGQALRDAARARQARIAGERRRRIATSELRVRALYDRVAVQRERQRQLSRDLIPRAQAILDEMEHAADTRLLSLVDVLQARRTMSELLIEEADSYADAFNAHIELLAEYPRASAEF